MLDTELFGFVAAVHEPPIGLEEDSRAKVVLVPSPPVGGARGRAARAENALIETIKLLAILLALLHFKRGFLRLKEESENIGPERRERARAQKKVSSGAVEIPQERDAARDGCSCAARRSCSYRAQGPE